MSITDLLTENSDILTATGAFSSVVIREDSSPVTGREPVAYIEYGGMSSVDDGGVMTEEHTVKIFIRLLSIGRADLSPLDKAFKAVKTSGAMSVQSALDSTDSRTVTFRLTAKYRMVTA